MGAGERHPHGNPIRLLDNLANIGLVITERGTHPVYVIKKPVDTFPIRSERTVKQEVFSQDLSRDRFVPPVPELFIEAPDEITISYLHLSFPSAIPLKILRLNNASINSQLFPLMGWTDRALERSR